MKSKKALKTLLFVLLLIILILFTWIFFGTEDRVTETPTPSPEPFGSGGGTNVVAPFTLPADFEGEIEQGDAEGVTTTETSEGEVFSLFRITSTPVSGYTFVNSATGTDSLRYVDRATGHIFDTKISDNNSLEKIRLSNATLPKIYEAHFRNDGMAVILRTLENGSDLVRNLSLSLKPNTGTSTQELLSVDIKPLDNNIDSVSPSTNSVFYYFKKNRKEISASDFFGLNQKSIYYTPFTNWSIEDMGTSLLIYTKPTFLGDGLALSLSTTTRATKKLVGPLRGLMVKPNKDGSKLLYSYNNSGYINLFYRNTKSNENVEISTDALAQKCIWSSINADVFYCATPVGGLFGQSPDDWFMGRTNYSDYIWTYNVSLEQSDLVINPKDKHNLDLDIYDLKLDSDERFIAFINKKDLTLWALRLR